MGTGGGVDSRVMSEVRGEGLFETLWDCWSLTEKEKGALVPAGGESVFLVAKSISNLLAMALADLGRTGGGEADLGQLGEVGEKADGDETCGNSGGFAFLMGLQETQGFLVAELAAEAGSGVVGVSLLLVTLALGATILMSRR